MTLIPIFDSHNDTLTMPAAQHKATGLPVLLQAWQSD